MAYNKVITSSLTQGLIISKLYSTLLDWFSENHILSIIFGETSHTELIRRSSPLLRFLFTQKRISHQDLEMIANLAFSKHDAFRTFVFKALADVAESMNVEELEVNQFLFCSDASYQRMY